jgi:putative nucleotidyltransferase with HDIG domain
MAETGVLVRLLPELDACRGVEQKGLHRFDVFTHSILACDAASVAESRTDVRMAALLHDIGKPAAKRIADDGTITFHRHEEISERLAHRVLRRLRCPRAFEDSVCHLILHHMFHYEPNWSDAAVRRFLSRVGIEGVDPLFELRRADSAAIAGREPGTPGAGSNLVELADRIRRVQEQDEAITIGDLAVNGNDLHREAGIPKSREMGVVLEFLLEAVLDDPHLNTTERLLEMARNYYQDRVRPAHDE